MGKRSAKVQKLEYTAISKKGLSVVGNTNLNCINIENKILCGNALREYGSMVWNYFALDKLLQKINRNSLQNIVS